MRRLQELLDDPSVGEEPPERRRRGLLRVFPGAGRDPDIPEEELPVHALPDESVQRKGPFGLSTTIHVLAIVALVLIEARSLQNDASTAKPPLDIVLTEPVPPAEPQPRSVVPFRPPPVRHAERPAPHPAEPKTPISPPAAPKVLPPAQPLPPPTRMGEMVPVPHYPVPGTVPPEEKKSGKPGEPVPEEKVARAKSPGTPDGTNDVDKGAGGPGSSGLAAGGPGASPGQGAVQGGPTGSLQVPRPGGGVSPLEGKGGGGHRRGLDYTAPVDIGNMGDFQFDDNDYDWNDFQSQMYYAILRAWRNRLYVMTPIFERWAYQHHTPEIRGTVLIHWMIERSGTVTSIEVIEPSTLSPLDESATSALKEVILPRLPADFTKDREGVTGRFIIEPMEVEYLKEGLKYMKYQGDF